jgi:hypothetical protein
MSMGCAGIHLRSSRAGGYILIALTKRHRTSGGYSPIKKEKRRLCDHINVVALLRSGGVRGASVIWAYHARGWHH